MTTLPKDIDKLTETEKPRLRIERDSELKQRIEARALQGLGY